MLNCALRLENVLLLFPFFPREAEADANSRQTRVWNNKSVRTTLRLNWTFWDILGHFGIFWDILGPFGRLFDKFGACRLFS